MHRCLLPLFTAVIAAAVVLVLSGASAPANCRRLSCLQATLTRAAVPLASINLKRETITPSDSNVRVSGIDFGSKIAFTVSDDSAPLVYRLSIPLSSGELLTVLSAGGAAITQTLPTPPGDYSGSNPPDDYQDNLDQVHDDGQIVEAAPSDGQSGDDTAEIEDNQDPSWYPKGDEVESDTRDGEDIASDALTQVEHQIPDGNYVLTAALDPPLATDADGREIPIFLTKGRGGLAVSIVPSSSTTFPIKVVLRYGYDPDSYDAEG